MYSVPEPGVTVPDYVAHLKRVLPNALEMVCNQMAVEQLRQMEQYDLKVHGKSFAVGAQVWLFNPAVPCEQARKFHCPWNGPYRVLERLSKVNCLVQHLRNHKKSVIHFDRLKSCHPGTRFPKPDNSLPVTGTPREKDAHTGDHLELLEQDYIPPSQPARQYPVQQ